MGILFTAEVMYLSSKWVSLLCGLTTEFDCLQPIWKKKEPSENADFWKKKSNVSIFKNVSSGNILDPGRTFRETQEWEMFALLAKGVWNPDLDSFSLWIDLNVCPALWEGTFCQAGRSASEFGKAFSLTLQHSSNIFYATVKIFFSGQETNFLPNSIFKQQVRTNPPTKCFLHAFRSFSSSAPCNNCNSDMHTKWEITR